MTAPPGILPRFVPTLTEVVETPGLSTMAAPLAPDSEAIVRSVMQQMQRQIDRRLTQEIDALARKLVAQQLPSLRLSLSQELAANVRQTVLEAIARRSDAQN